MEENKDLRAELNRYKRLAQQVERLNAVTNEAPVGALEGCYINSGGFRFIEESIVESLVNQRTAKVRLMAKADVEEVEQERDAVMSDLVKARSTLQSVRSCARSIASAVSRELPSD